MKKSTLIAASMLILASACHKKEVTPTYTCTCHYELGAGNTQTTNFQFTMQKSEAQTACADKEAKLRKSTYPYTTCTLK